MTTPDKSTPARSPKAAKTQLRVGRLVKAHGLKGALKLELYTDDPEGRFSPGASFTLQVPESSPWHGKSLTVREFRWMNSHPVAFFDGVDDRSAAEELVRAILWIDQDPEDAPTEDDAWYDHQLVGLDVIRDGEIVGRVVRVDHFPAQDLLIVRAPGDREVLVPFVKAIVPEVDVAGGRVIVTPPAGLFEELPGEDDPRRTDVAHRRRLDLPGLLRRPGSVAAGQGSRERSAGRPRPRPARMDARPAPHGRRHPVRRRRRHGDEAGALGRGARRHRRRRAEPIRCSSSPRPPARCSRRLTRASSPERPHLVFGCGRYEGIDERVYAHAASLGEVRLVSLGDYVLNGGEVAAMAMIEAIGRLIPGVVGNPESLVEESHEEGLLEYPSYTKPAVWRGREVPPVLLSGHHAAISAWRREQQIARTRERRPDLLAADGDAL